MIRIFLSTISVLTLSIIIGLVYATRGTVSAVFFEEFHGLVTEFVAVVQPTEVFVFAGAVLVAVH